MDAQEYSYTETIEYTPNNVYGFDWRKSVENYEVVGFRPLSKDDNFDLFFLSLNRVIYPCLGSHHENNPLLILRKKKLRRFVFDECSKDEARVYGGYWILDGNRQIVLTSYIDADTVFVKPVAEK